MTCARGSLSVRLSILVFILIATAAAEQITLPRGLPIKLVMPQPVTFTTARVGTNIDWVVAEDVVVGDYIVVRSGATARARVDTAVDSGSRPRMTLKMQFVELASGQRALLRALENPNDRRPDSIDFYGTGLVANSSNNTVIPEGYEQTVYIDETTRVNGQALAAKGALVGAPKPSTAMAAKDTLVLTDGTPVELRLGQTVSSEDATVGDRLDLRVVNEVRVGNLVVIPKDAIVWGTVTEARRKRSMGRAGRLAITIDYVRLPGGDKFHLRADKAKRGDDHKKAMTGAMVATTVLVWPLAPAWLMMEGEDTTMKKGMTAVAFVDGDYPLDPQRWGYAPLTIPPRPSSAAPSKEMTSTVQVSIGSTPSGAEIFVDSVFVGQTPSSVGLQPGTHALIIKKRGYAAWTRSLAISTGNVNINADLRPLPKGR